MTRKLSFSIGSERSGQIRPILRLTLGLVGSLILCSVGGPPSQAAVSAPPWLVAASHVDIGRFGDGSSAVMVAQWDDFQVDATGKFVWTERRAIRILHRHSAEPYLKAVGYENSDQSVRSIQSWAIAPSGRVVQSDKKDVVTQAAFAEFELFSDDRAKIIEIPGAEEGALVGYEVIRIGRGPLGGEKFALDGEIPVLMSELHVSVASGSLRWFLNHPDRVQVTSQSANSAAFRAANRPAIAKEDDTPPYWSLVSAVFVNYDAQGTTAVQSWEEAGRVIHPLLSGAEKSTPDLAAETETLTAGKADALSKLDSVYTFVSRQIRYVAVEIGIGGFQPHPAADVFKYKYGDCKDKATLLITMLDHIGLRGYPAMVGTRTDIEADPKVPTLTTFDHMIVALPVSGELQGLAERFAAYDRASHILWIDPTSESDPLGQLPEMDQGVFALVSYPDRGELLRIPESPAGQNGMEYSARVRLTPAGQGTAEVEVKYLGASNARRHEVYRNRSQNEIRAMFEERVGRYAGQAAFQKASVSGLEDNGRQVVENFSFSGNFSIAASASSWFFQPLFLNGMAVPEIGPQPRVFPLDLGVPHHLKGEYRIELPPNARPSGIPEKTSIRSEYGSLDIEYSANDNILWATETLSFDLSRIPPDKYSDFRDFVNKALRLEQQRLRALLAP